MFNIDALKAAFSVSSTSPYELPLYYPPAAYTAAGLWDKFQSEPANWAAAAPLQLDAVLRTHYALTTPLSSLVSRPPYRRIDMARFLDPFRVLGPTSPAAFITLPVVSFRGGVGSTPPSGPNDQLAQRLEDLAAIVHPNPALIAQQARLQPASPRSPPGGGGLTQKAQRDIAKSMRVCMGFVNDTITDEELVYQALEKLYPYASGGKQALVSSSQRQYYQNIIDECYKKQILLNS